MNENIPWNVIIKKIRKSITEKESLELDEWLGTSELNRKVFSEILNIARVTTSAPEYFVPNKEKAWEKINSRIELSQAKPKPSYSKYGYVAAALVFVIMSFFFLWFYHSGNMFYQRQSTEVISPMGQKTMIVLPDSSLVWLNSGSTLKYSGVFNKKEREVILEGEAFFEVRKNSSKMFRVKAGILFVDVYGTSFNVKNYADDNTKEVTVSSGRVSVGDSQKALKSLTKGQQAVLNKTTNKLSVVNAEPDVVSSWKNNELKFDNTPLTEVVKYLERWYGVNINIEKSMIGKHNYTFKIKTESLTEILEKIKIITPIAYEINGKDVRIRYIN